MRTRTALALAVLVSSALVALAAVIIAERWLRGDPIPSLAWFYGTPLDGTSAQTIAREHGVVILTYGDEEFRQELRASGYEEPIAQYVTLSRVEGPPSAAASDGGCDGAHVPFKNQVAWFQGDFCGHVHPNEEWFLHNAAGERLYGDEGERFVYAMNPGNDGWRAFFLARVRQATAGDGDAGPFGYDALFLDEIWGTLHVLENDLANSDGGVAEYATDDEYERDVIRFVASVRSAVEVPVWGNANPKLEPDRFTPYLDGEMLENFAASWRGEWRPASEVEGSWRRVTRLAREGKEAILVGQGDREERERARYAYAAYLMVAADGVSFRFHDSADYRSLWWYPEFDVELGGPTGPRREVAEDAWAREFERGVAAVNLSGDAARAVELSAPVRLSDGNVARRITLEPHEGAVLPAADPG